MNKKKGWMFVAIGTLSLSLLSLFLPVITYNSSEGIMYSYNLIKLLNAEDFLQNVLADTHTTNSSSFMLLFDKYSSSDALPKFLTIMIVLIAVFAIIISFIGIISMSKQYESAAPFVLSILGLVGTAIPAIALIIITILTRNFFHEPIKLGLYAFITPIAMVIAIIAVNSRHKLSKEQQELVRAASAYLKPAGDLPTVQHQRGNQYVE